MGPMFASITVLALAALIRVDGTYYEALAAHADIHKFEPMVAFICGKPAMYRTVDGWKSDEDITCLQKKEDILRYCRKKYPNEDIRNVVEASEFVTISNWCQAGRKHCHHHGKHTVRPFRCFVGPFQSDALLVPQHCNFSHEHSSKTCFPFDHWNITAQRKCSEREMHLQSFAMLQPCGLGVFSGVEYVCCPGTKESMPVRVQKPIINEPEKVGEKPVEREDEYYAYLHHATDGKHNEHERFKAAERVYNSKHHEQITKMMKDWAVARKDVQELKATDPRLAERKNKEITERFQKTYQAFEEEGAAMKKQLVDIHQNRVQAKLNAKKRETMNDFLDALKSNPVRVDLITKTLEAYIRSEEKDRIHSINHFEHVRETDGEMANRILPQTQEHLRIIDQRVNQSLTLLKKLPVNVEKKILLQIKEFMKSYRSVDETIKHVLSQPVMIVKQKIEKEPLPTTQVPVSMKKAENHIEKEPIHLDLDKPQMEVKAIKPEVKPTKKYDPESMEDEHIYMKKKKHYAHALDNGLNVEQGLHHSDNQRVVMHTGGTAGIAIGSVAVFVIIIVAIVLLRKKAKTEAPNAGSFVEVEPSAASPEERHVANMQINGYENPTYKYFETSN